MGFPILVRKHIFNRGPGSKGGINCEEVAGLCRKSWQCDIVNYDIPSNLSIKYSQTCAQITLSIFFNILMIDILQLISKGSINVLEIPLFTTERLIYGMSVVISKPWDWLKPFIDSRDVDIDLNNYVNSKKVCSWLSMAGDAPVHWTLSLVIFWFSFFISTKNYFYDVFVLSTHCVVMCIIIQRHKRDYFWF